MIKKWWYLLLVAAWMLPGLVARDPWKADEAYTYGLVWHMNQTGDWVVPQLGGEPFMQKPPLFFAVANLFCQVFSGIFGFTAAAHGANLVFLTLTLYALWRASTELNGGGFGPGATILFMGSLIYLHTAHQLMTDVSLVAGFAVAFYGTALGLRKPVAGGLWLGTGMGIAFMSKGLLGPGLMAVSIVATGVFFSPWRSRQMFGALGVGLLASLPWVLVWPMILYYRDQELFNQWFLDNNLGRFLGAERVGRPNTLGLDGSRYWFLTALPWYTWPAFPLLCVAAWRDRATLLKDKAFQLSLTTLLVVAGVLTASRNGRELYGLPLLVPAAILGDRGLPYLRSAFRFRWHRATLSIFGLAMAVAWLGWLAVVVGWPASVGTIIHRKLPDLHPSFQPVACALALTTSFAWLGWMIRQPKDHPLSPAVNWTAGPVLLYTLAMSIWLPALESNMSYRHLGAARDHLPPPTECVSSINLGEPQRAMFHYYTGLKTERRELGRGTNCNWLLTVANARHPEPDRDPGPGWTLKWQDIHSRKELFRLYQRDTSGDAHSSR